MKIELESLEKEGEVFMQRKALLVCEEKYEDYCCKVQWLWFVLDEVKRLLDVC